MPHMQSSQILYLRAFGVIFVYVFKLVIILISTTNM